MILRNISHLGGLDIPLIGQLVPAGGEFEVSPAHARRLLVQESNFEPVDDTARALARELRAEADERERVAEPAEVDEPIGSHEPVQFDDGHTAAAAEPVQPAAPAPRRGRNQSSGASEGNES